MRRIAAVLAAGAILICGSGIAESIIDAMPGDYVFCSGAGGWRTEMILGADLSFSGEYSDSEMGESGEGYEYGTCYIADFEGSFSKPEQQADGTYTMSVAELVLAEEPGEERIEDNIRYVSEEAYGINEGDEFIVYPKGFPTADMEESALTWAALTMAWGDNVPEQLTDCVIYNTTQESAFVRQWFE